MDPSVKEALVRWPNVPAVFGWLSLDERGRWRLHPQGDAATGGPGEPIPNLQIQQFINRNYECDGQGRWFFQNGPQRVYVRLDGAPYVLRRADAGPGLVLHTGTAVQSVHSWWLDESGRLYAHCDAGAALVDDRELPGLLTQLQADGRALIDLLDTPSQASLALTHPALAAAAPLLRDARRADMPALLDFVANPQG